MHVETTSALKSSRILGEKTRTVSQANPEYEVTMDARLVSAGHGLLSGEVATSRDCTQEVLTTREVTTAWTREATDSGWVWAGGVVGALGASALAWGIHEHANGEPLSRTPPGKDSAEITTVGAAVYFGGAASLLLVEALVTGLRTFDSETTELVANTTSTRTRCERAPAAGAVVAIQAHGLVVAQAESDARGHYQVEVDAPGSAKEAALSMTINRQAVATPASLRALDLVFAAASAHAGPASEPPAAAAKPPAQALFLYGVPLRGAERAALESAIEQAGGRRVLTLGSKNISQFDIALLNLPGLQRMKLMFDGQNRFVQAKYQGQISEVKRQEVIAALVERYGSAKEASPGPVQSWAFDDGLALTFRIETTPKGQYTLSYVDASAEAALRDAVKKTETAK